MAEKQDHARSNPLASQFMNFTDVRPGKFMELKPAVNSGRTFCDFMETTPKETVIGFFREVINHIEQARGIRDYHLKVKGSKPRAGFVTHVFYGEDREGPEKIEPGSCISCHGDALQFPGVEGSVLAGEYVLAEFSEDQPYVQCSMDAKARAGFIVTPVRHVETMGALEDEELYCLWRVGARALRSEGLQPGSMIFNHGRYRNLPHLHLKIWVDDGVHRQARLKWNVDRKRVWARLERFTSSSLCKKRAFCPGFERQDLLAEEKSPPYARQVFDEIPLATSALFHMQQQYCQDLELALQSPNLTVSTSTPHSGSRDPIHLQQANFQIQITLLTVKTLLLGVQPSFTVRHLLKILEQRLGIPSSLLRLLFAGKQLDNNLPLSFYNIERNATVILSLRLRGGAVGQSSTSKDFSYKDAVHAQPAKKSAQSAEAPKPFLVDKMEETPAIEISHPSLDDQYQTFAETALICRFNGLWPRTADLYQWIHSNWTNNCKVFLCSKGFFIVAFAFNEDYQKALTGGPWFWGSAGLFLSPWFPDFDPSTAVITKLPIWVKLPNLPAHLWHFAVFQGIGDTLGRHLATDTSRAEKGIYTFGRICAEIDISKGLPDQIILKVGDFHWTQTLDYENTAFRCRHCHQTGHLQNSCASFFDKKKNITRKSKSKSWKPCDIPPMDDIESSSSDEEDIEVEEENLEQPKDAPSARAEDHSAPLLSQKRSHESSPSDSDKESPPLAQNNLQVVLVQPDQNGWVKVSKKKGKKGRLEDSAHAG